MKKIPFLIPISGVRHVQDVNANVDTPLRSLT